MCAPQPPPRNSNYLTDYLLAARPQSIRENIFPEDIEQSVVTDASWRSNGNVFLVRLGDSSTRPPRRKLGAVRTKKYPTTSSGSRRGPLALIVDDHAAT